MDSLCRVRNKIITRVLFWYLFPSLLRNSGNKHQNNPLVSTETVRDSSTYIILYKILTHFLALLVQWVPGPPRAQALITLKCKHDPLFWPIMSKTSKLYRYTIWNPLECNHWPISMYWDSKYTYKMVAKFAYIYNVNAYTDKTESCITNPCTSQK